MDEFSLDSVLCRSSPLPRSGPASRPPHPPQADALSGAPARIRLTHPSHRSAAVVLAASRVASLGRLVVLPAAPYD